jgi:hypothetical protein
MIAPARGATASTEESPILPLHTAVPGRARFKIANLYVCFDWVLESRA